MPIISNFPTGGNGSGGIALAPISNISTLFSSEKAYFKWTDPIDTIAGEVTLAEWAGTLLVRKAGSVPSSRRDGTVVLDSKVRNVYQNQYFCDSGLSNGVKYYYKFFPYSATHTYTSDVANEVTITPNAVMTDDVTNIEVVATLNGRVQIKWTDPAATKVVDGVTLATWASTKIVYKAGSYPTSPEDGTLFLNSTTHNGYSSTPLEVAGLTNGTTYYFGFFPISTEGAVNTNTANGITAIPNRIKITTVPTQSGSLTYNGGAQSPSWSNYDSTKMTLSGATSGTNAGTYSATFTPKNDYCWSDNSIAAKTVTWSIGKATGSLSLSKTSITLNDATPSTTFTVTRAGDGAISISSSNSNIAAVSLSGTTVTVTGKTTGTAVITVSVAAGTNYTAPSNKTCTVSSSVVSTILNDNDWATIRRISDAGTGANYWAVGDAKQIIINGTVGLTAISNYSVWAFILGFNHNSSREGSNRIHFQIGRTAQTYSSTNAICFIDSTYGKDYGNVGSFAMNSSAEWWNATSVGGWNACEMRGVVLGSNYTPTSPLSNTFLAALPRDLRAVMKFCTKYSDNTGDNSDNASYVTATTDYLWLLSEFEVQGVRAIANSAEQNYQLQYKFYKAGNSKTKYAHTSKISATWWTRSVRSEINTYFCYINAFGNMSSTYASAGCGVAPAFCV